MVVFGSFLGFQPNNGINHFPKNCFPLKIFSEKKSSMPKQKYQISLDPNEAM